MTTRKEERRFPGPVYGHGDEPDARFSLANERTFLAWLRTALALLAGGVGLETLGLGMQPSFRLAASLTLILAGIATPIQAWIGWMRTERALRLNSPLPSPALSGPLGVVIVLVGVLVLCAIVLA